MVDTLPWDAIDDVLLDMDGTLLDLAFDNHFWQELLPDRLARARGIGVDVARAELEPVFRAKLGSLDWYCIDFWTRHTGLDIAALKREVAAGVRLLPETLDVLDALAARGKRLWLVTNAHPETLAIKLERAPIAARFHRIVSSHDLRAPKEHAAFWERLHARHPFDRRAALMVDDSEPVLRAAGDFGVAHLVAAAWPDRSRPARAPAGFHAVTTLDQLLGGV